MSYEFHTPVLLHKAIDFLINPEKNHSLIVDCTTGGGGYGLEICRRVYPNVNLICLDKDLEALNHAKITLEKFSDKITYINGNFGELDKILDELNIDKLDGIVFDLGLSSYQIEKEDGFSFMRDTPLDMRAYKKDDLTDKDIINNYNNLKQMFNSVLGYVLRSYTFITEPSVFSVQTKRSCPVILVS